MAKPFKNSTVENRHPYTFGTLIRALRLGYRWSEKRQCFVRLSPAGDRVHVTLAPGNRIPAKVYGKEHFCWWEEGKTHGMLADYFGG